MTYWLCGLANASTNSIFSTLTICLERKHSKCNVGRRGWPKWLDTRFLTSGQFIVPGVGGVQWWINNHSLLNASRQSIGHGHAHPTPEQTWSTLLLMSTQSAHGQCLDRRRYSIDGNIRSSRLVHENGENAIVFVCLFERVPRNMIMALSRPL